MTGLVFPSQSNFNFILSLATHRLDGAEAHDGEAGGPQDPPGAEEDDERGDGRQQQHHQLPGLCEDDAGQTLRRPQAVSLSAVSVFCRVSRFATLGWGGGGVA